MKTETNAITVEELNAAAGRLTALHQRMNYLAVLTPEQRKEKHGMRIGARKLDLTKNRVAVAVANPGLLPAAFDLPRLERDTAVCVALLDILTVLGRIWDSVNDTLLVVGGPAIITAATAHAHMKVASETAQRLTPTMRRQKGRSQVNSPMIAAPAATVEPATPVVLPLPVAPFKPASEAA